MSQKEKFLNNIKLLTITFMVSVISIFLIFPLIMNLHFVKDFLNSSSLKLFTGITALNLIILILTWEKAHKLWERYKNTKETKNFQLIYIDIVGLYIVFTISLGIAFLSVSTSSEFQYFMLINLLLLLIWFFSSFYIKMKIPTKEESKNKDSLSDEPITSPEQDKLRRRKFIDELYNEINIIPDITSGSFTLGLHGSWGEGKTSVINLLVNKFQNNQDFLVVNFDPWYFENEEAILKSFYTRIQKAIHDKYIFPDFKRAILKYQKAITTGISFPGFNFDLKSPDRSIEELKEKIEKYISQIGKTLLIIIDDIDRLQPKESFLIFKLVRKNTNFKNTIFLLSFDQTIIKKYLINNPNTDPDFLEKIINKLITLPAIEKELLYDFLHSKLDELFRKINIGEKDIETFWEPFDSIYRLDIKKLFNTLRHVKRYVNGLFFTLPAIKHEVNPYDFLILEIIRVFKIELYEDIWSNPWFYTTSINGLISSPFDLFTNEEEKLKEIRNHIDNLLKNQPEKEIFEKLLSRLFPDIIEKALKEEIEPIFGIGYKNGKSARVSKRIDHPDCFKKYFTHQVPSSEISDEYIELIIKALNFKEESEQMRNIKEIFFENKTEYGVDKLLDKFKNFTENINSLLALSFIKVIYTNIDKFSKEGFDSIIGSEYREAKVLMLFLINDRIEKEEIPNVIEDAVLNTHDLYFSVSVILSCKKDRGGQIYKIFDSIDVEYLKDKVSRRLEEYFIEGKKDIFESLNKNEWNFILYQWANWITYNGKNKEIVSDYVLSLIKDDAKKFSKFLMKVVDEKYPPPEKPSFGEFKRIYKFKEFEKIAKKYKDDKQLSEEERKIINIFLEHVSKLAH